MKVTPFRAARPSAESASEISVLPYDVVTYDEIKSAANLEKSFFHVTRAEIDLPNLKNPYDQKVYDKSAEALNFFLEKGWLVRDQKDCFYIYQETFLGRSQTGLVALASLDEYKSNLIKKHELTRKDKEQDRINHLLTCKAHAEPVFLTIQPLAELKKVFGKLMTSKNLKCDFVSQDQVTHKLWQVEDSADIVNISRIFSEVPCSYIADGHHRAAAALEVSKSLGNSGFMAVVFPCDELLVLPYHRVVLDHKRLGWAKIRELAEKHFEFSTGPVVKKHEFGVLADGQWHKMTTKKFICNDSDPIKTLDVHILQEYFLKEIFDIKDPRTDKNIDFIGGIKGQKGIEDFCGKNKSYIGLSLYATSVTEMMNVADQGLVMPPKSTWFEPKLRSGLFVYLV